MFIRQITVNICMFYACTYMELAELVNGCEIFSTNCHLEKNLFFSVNVFLYISKTLAKVFRATHICLPVEQLPVFTIVHQ